MLHGERTWVEISKSALEYNYKQIRSKIAGKYLAVVKANAYGHGDIAVAGFLQELGAEWFGVATAQEGMALRKSGITKPILIFGYTLPELADILVDNNLTQTVYCYEYGKKIAQKSAEMGVSIDCHLKLDTGMSRLGFDIRDDKFYHQVNELYSSALNFTGIFTHFAVADETADSSIEFTKKQFDAFDDICKQLEKMGLSLGVRHCANSAAAICYPEMQMDMVRVGIAQYGLSPSPEIADVLPLTPAMSFCSTVAQVKEIALGDTVSYGRKYIATEMRKVATVTAGYADGYPRKLSGQANVIINGQYAPVIGRVCMDQLVADVTDIPDVNIGDRVLLVGEENGVSVTFDDIAKICDTINYECMCNISARVRRIFV